MLSLPQATVVTTRSADTLHVVPTGEIDQDTVHLLRDALGSVVAGSARRVVVDLHQVDLLDEAALDSLVSTHRQLRARGGTLILRRPQPQVLHAIRRAQLDRRVAVVGTAAPRCGPPRQTRSRD